MGVITGSAGVVAAGATVWGAGAGAGWVHPADRRMAIKMTRIAVLNIFIDCILYGRVHIGCGSVTREKIIRNIYPCEIKRVDAVTMEDPVLLFIGALISGMAGLIFSMVGSWLGDKKEKHNISKAFLLDIESIESTISPIVDAYKKSAPATGHPLRVADIISLIRKEKPYYYLNKDIPLYPKDGAYYIFRSEMIKLEFKTVGRLYEFYKKIIFADNRLLNYYNLSSTDGDALQRYELQEDFFKALTEAHAKIPELKKILYANIM
jgi:hypothetical protein